MFRRTPAELQTLISNIDQAIYNHDRWYEALLATLMCHLPYDEHDVHEESFHRCRFGQWLYGEGQRLLSDHASYAAIEGEHRRMHQLAARLLLAVAEGQAIDVQDYEHFTSAVKSLRLEATTLKRELGDLLSRIDPLTGVNGRTSLLTVLRELQALVKRKVMPCSIVMVDLDYFKAINDSYGHQAGDRVLTVCAQYLVQHLRPYDKVFRYGGEDSSSVCKTPARRSPWRSSAIFAKGWRSCRFITTRCSSESPLRSESLPWKPTTAWRNRWSMPTGPCT